MKTIEDLGRRVKAYPRYQHLSDAEAGRQAQIDFPGKYDDFGTTTIALPNLEIQIPNQTVSLDHLYKLYKPNRGTFTSWWHNRKAPARLALLETASTEMRAVLDQWEIQAQHLRAKQIGEVDFKMFLARNAQELLQINAEAQLLEQALEDGLTIENSQTLKVAKAQSQIRIDEQREMTAIELDKLFAESREAVRNGIISKKMTNHQQIFVIQELLDLAYDQIHQIENSNFSDDIKRKKIEDREQTIKALKEDKHARETGLFQDDSWKDPKGSIPTPILAKRDTSGD